jgi:hypothetical protein
MSEARIELLVKTRDAHRMIAESIDDYLQTLAPPSVKGYDLSKILWHEKTGDKGPFELALLDEQKSDDLATLIKDLEDHSGKMQVSGFFVWLMSDKKSVGRKPAKK